MLYYSVMEKNKKIKRYKNIIGIILYMAAAFAMCMIFSRLWCDDIWYDEVFSLGFIKRSYSDIIAVTAMDVHPPLYYIYLKFITDLLMAILRTESVIPMAKLASALPWVGLLLLSVTYIRKRWGFFVSGLFLFAVTAMPQFTTYYAEIRMYSLALLLVSAELILAYEIFLHGGSCILWILYAITGILTAYTQYYACVAVIGIYIALILISFIYGGDNKGRLIGGTLVCAIISVVAYLPWLGILKKQIENISGSYWIQPLGIRSLAGCVKFFILPSTDRLLLSYICAGLSLISLAIAFVITIADRNNKVLLPVALSLAPVVTVILSGFVLSAMGTPIFIYRYMLPTAGGVWLAMSICTDKTIDIAFNKTDGLLFGLVAGIILISPVILTGSVNTRGFYGEERWKEIHMSQAKEAMDKVDTEAVLVTNFDHVTAIMSYYRPDGRVYLYEDDVDRLIPQMFDSAAGSATDGDILNVLSGGKQVYFLGSFNSREDIIENWENAGIGSELMDSVLIERYWINIYKLNSMQ